MENSGERSLRTISAQETRDVGAALGRYLKSGDLLILSGDLGAGKTTLVQGIAEGLGVEGRVTSPTYIIARVHAGIGAAPDLVHVDAYRLDDELDLETIDLDSSIGSAVTVVEWGSGKAESLSDARLEVHLDFVSSSQEDCERVVILRPVGSKWLSRVERMEL